jgi:hypothetical protein
MIALLGRDVEIYVTLAMKLTFMMLTGGVQMHMTFLPPHAHLLCSPSCLQPYEYQGLFPLS